MATQLTFFMQGPTPNPFGTTPPPPTPPSITTQPSATSVAEGATATFSVVATGTGTLTYQWQVNTGTSFVNVSNGTGGTTASYTTVTTTAGMNGYSYRVIVTNAGGSTTSSAGGLTVTTTPPPPTGPTISTQPTAQSVTEPATATFSVVATGTGTVTYQWQIDTGSGTFVDVTGAEGSGGTTASFTTVATTVGMNGYEYRVIVTDDNDSTTSDVVGLTVADGGGGAPVLADTTATMAMSLSWDVPDLAAAVDSGTVDWSTIEFIDQEGHTFIPAPTEISINVHEANRITRAVPLVGQWIATQGTVPTIRFLPTGGFIGNATLWWRVQSTNQEWSNWAVIRATVTDPNPGTPDLFTFTYPQGNQSTIQAEIGVYLELANRYYSRLLRNTSGWFQAGAISVAVDRYTNLEELTPGYNAVVAAASVDTQDANYLTLTGSLHYATDHLLESIVSRGQLEHTILHEMGHILGLTEASDPALYEMDGPTKLGFLGTNAVTLWRTISGDTDATYAPVFTSHFGSVPDPLAGAWDYDNTALLMNALNGQYAEAAAASTYEAAFLTDMGYTVDNAHVYQIERFLSTNIPPGSTGGGVWHASLGAVGSASIVPSRSVGLVGTTPERAPYHSELNVIEPSFAIGQTLDLKTIYIAGDDPIDWTTAVLYCTSHIRSATITAGSSTAIINVDGESTEITIALDTNGIVTISATAAPVGTILPGAALMQARVSDTANRISIPYRFEAAT